MEEKITINKKQNDFLMNYYEYSDLIKGIDFLNTLDILPDDPKILFDRIDKEIPDDFNLAIEKLNEISVNNTEFFIQIMALVDVLNGVNISSKDDLTNKLKKQKEQELYLEIFNTLKNIKNKK